MNENTDYPSLFRRMIVRSTGGCAGGYRLAGFEFGARRKLGAAYVH